MFSSAALLSALAGTAMAGTVIWDGRFNNMTSSTDLNNWSFSNPVGQYQYYIHGTGPVTEYVNLDSTYKNPADSSSNKGVKITLDQNAVWNSDGMLRTELIPQTSAPINKGKVYYHFSMKHTGVNAPSQREEHQVCFFESHFTEMKYGLISGEQGTADNSLRWDVGGNSKWNVTYEAGVWHNIAYAIDFDAQTVGFWHSTGADDLKLTAGPFSASTSSNGADWHLGVLRLASQTGASDTAAEDWYFSGVYVESGDLTTSVSGPGGLAHAAAAPASSSASSAAAVAVTSVAAAAATSSSGAPLLSASAYNPVSPYNPIATAPATTLQTSVRPTSSVVAPVSSSADSSSAASSADSTTVVYSTATLSPVESTTSTAVATPATTSLPAYTVPAVPFSTLSIVTVANSSALALSSPATTLLSAFDQSAATTALATNYITASVISASSASVASVSSASVAASSSAAAVLSSYSAAVSSSAEASLSSSSAAAASSSSASAVASLSAYSAAASSTADAASSSSAVALSTSSAAAVSSTANAASSSSAVALPTSSASAASSSAAASLSAYSAAASSTVDAASSSSAVALSSYSMAASLTSAAAAATGSCVVEYVYV